MVAQRDSLVGVLALFLLTLVTLVSWLASPVGALAQQIPYEGQCDDTIAYCLVHGGQECSEGYFECGVRDCCWDACGNEYIFDYTCFVECSGCSA